MNHSSSPISKVVNMSKQIIVVFGATGKQGGSVVSSLLSDSAAGKFHVRAITRDVTKASAKALALKGAEVIAVCLLWENVRKQADREI